MSKKVKIIILIFVAILLVVISAIIFKVVLNKNIEKQKNTVLGYFSCINDKDYEKMYEFLSSTSKENISKEDFIKRNKNIYEGIDTTSLEIKIKKLSKLKENKKQVQVIYDENFFTSAGEVSFCNTLILVKENKEYKLNWNSKLIFPELEDDYKVRFSNLKSKRGSIFDRNGIELAHDGKISEIGIVPGKLPENKDEQIQKISELLDISVEKINSLLSASYVKDDTFVSLKKISKSNEELKSKLLEISGIMISNADGRVYELGEEAAHLIGYIQTINAEELKEHEGQNYTSTSVIGKSGLEYYYEQTLRGIDGSEIYIEDAKGKKVKTILCQEKKTEKIFILQ